MAICTILMHLYESTNSGTYMMVCGNTTNLALASPSNQTPSQGQHTIEIIVCM
jgi:hypothetical protein